MKILKTCWLIFLFVAVSGFPITAQKPTPADPMDLAGLGLPRQKTVNLVAPENPSSKWEESGWKNCPGGVYFAELPKIKLVVVHFVPLEEELANITPKPAKTSGTENQQPIGVPVPAGYSIFLFPWPPELRAFQTVYILTTYKDGSMGASTFLAMINLQQGTGDLNWTMESYTPGHPDTEITGKYIRTSEHVLFNLKLSPETKKCIQKK